MMTASIFLAIVNVTTASELVTAINNASPGDEIVLADGTYALTANVNCDEPGTASQPIIVRAANRLGAKITFDTDEGFKVSAAYWQFDGLDIEGVCASDPDCEHAFHVVGAADHFVLRHSRILDFNAQLKVNAQKIGDVYVAPNFGLVEYNEVGDTRPRDVDINPVTKLNIDTGDDWIVRGNYLHDAQKLGGNETSYLAFMKSGGKRGLFERNLAICSRLHTGGTRLGLSFGGGGTGAAFCAPAYDPDVPCDPEHSDGTMRNNIIANCSDVGIYLNLAPNSRILYNTLIGTTGIDFRFASTSGDVIGNLLTSVARERNGGTITTSMGNMTNVSVAQFEMWYAAPLTGDLSVVGDVSSLIASAPPDADVTNDYCAQPRPSSGQYTVGALEHSITPQCDTTRPPVGTDPPLHVDGVPGTGGDSGVGPDEPGANGSDSGCCQTQRTPDASIFLALGGLAWLLRKRRRR